MADEQPTLPLIKGIDYGELNDDVKAEFGQIEDKVVEGLTLDKSKSDLVAAFIQRERFKILIGKMKEVLKEWEDKTKFKAES